MGESHFRAVWKTSPGFETVILGINTLFTTSNPSSVICWMFGISFKDIYLEYLSKSIEKNQCNVENKVGVLLFTFLTTLSLSGA